MTSKYNDYYYWIGPANGFDLFLNTFNIKLQ